MGLLSDCLVSKDLTTLKRSVRSCLVKCLFLPKHFQKSSQGKNMDRLSNMPEEVLSNILSQGKNMDRLSNMPEEVLSNILSQGKNMDRLSNMPEEVLSNILSLMPTKFAVRTSILSKTWRYNWTLVTNIDIDCCNPFNGVENCSLFVDRVLNQCKTIQIKKFRLDFGPYWVQKSSMTKWIDEAVRLKVHELEVIAGLPELPISLFTCKTLTKLHIENRSCSTGMEWQTPFNLPSLKTLNMFVYKSPSPNALKLIQGCPILESLSLTVSHSGPREDYIFNVPTLKHLKLEVIGKCPSTTSKVVFNVPNLEHLFIGGQWCSQFVMEDFPFLVSVEFSFVLWIKHLWVEFLKGISGAKSISFKPDFGYCGCGLPEFPNCNLELISWYKLKWIPIFQILESCSGLECLCIEEQKDKPKYDKESEESHWIEPKSVPTCMLMSLQTIKFEKCMGQKDDIQFLEYMLGNAKVLKTLTIMCESGVMEEEFRLCAKLLKCPRASKYCEIHFIAKSFDSATC